MKNQCFKQLRIALGVAVLLMLVGTQLAFSGGFNKLGGRASLVGIGPVDWWCDDTAVEAADDGFDTQSATHQALVLGAKPFSDIFVNACGYQVPGYIARNNVTLIGSNGPTRIVFELPPVIPSETTCSFYLLFQERFGNTRTNDLVAEVEQNVRQCPPQ